MSRIRPLLVILLFTFLVTSLSAAEQSKRKLNFFNLFKEKETDPYMPYGDAYMVNYQEAVEKAAAEDKHVFMIFAGSDWNKYCKKFYRHILRKKKWIDYAEKRFVLLLIDSPKEYELPQELKEQNEALKKKWKIHGIPAIVILKDEQKVAHANYMNNHTACMYIKYIEYVLPSPKRWAQLTFLFNSKKEKRAARKGGSSTN